MLRKVLHVGCGRSDITRLPKPFQDGSWSEVRFDINPAVEPDLIGTITDMSAVETASVSAVYSSHNIEHVFPHEVPQVLSEFRRVLSEDGFAVITCPDLRSVAELVAQDRLLEPAYVAPSGPIAPLDMLYGHRASIARGNHYMAHRGGFTLKSLTAGLKAAGFAGVAGLRRASKFELWALGTVRDTDAQTLKAMAASFFPQNSPGQAQPASRTISRSVEGPPPIVPGDNAGMPGGDSASVPGPERTARFSPPIHRSVGARGTKSFIFMHQNMPGQFPHLVRHLRQNGHEVSFVGRKVSQPMPGVKTATYKLAETPEAAKTAFGPLHDAVRSGQGAAKGLMALKRDGVRPDAIIGHTGWGEMLFARDVFPEVPVLGYFEHYYRPEGADVNFDPEFQSDPNLAPMLRLRNMVNLSSLEACTRGISPTIWQQSGYPEIYRPKISVLHEGVDTTAIERPEGATFELPDGRKLTQEDEVVTYVARNLEPYRGFHIAMRAFAEICRSRPKAQILVVGGDSASYGRKLAPGEYRRRALAEVQIDPARVHFLGRIPYPKFLDLIYVSSAHIYLTYPFVLSWSMLEAMAAECLIIGSRTPPVEEVIVDRQNGLLVDFFDHSAVAHNVIRALKAPGDFRALRREARRTIVERYDLHGVALPRYDAALRDVGVFQ